MKQIVRSGKSSLPFQARFRLRIAQFGAPGGRSVREMKGSRVNFAYTSLVVCLDFRGNWSHPGPCIIFDQPKSMMARSSGLF